MLFCIFMRLCMLTAVVLQPGHTNTMSLVESWRSFAHWTGRNRIKSLLIIVGFIYITTLPMVRRLPPTAEERARNRERT